LFSAFFIVTIMGFATGSGVADGIGRPIVWVAKITTQPRQLNTKFSDMFVERIKNVMISGASGQIDFRPTILTLLKSGTGNLANDALYRLLWSDAPAITVTRQFVVLEDWIWISLYGTPSFNINEPRRCIAAVQPIWSYSPSSSSFAGITGVKVKLVK
jgi:hypothetical protein